MDPCTSKLHCSARSFFGVLTLLALISTPPTFTIYVCSLVLRSLLDSPPFPLEASAAPLSPLSKFASTKSSLIYSLIDESDFYIGTAVKTGRSRMNVTFRLHGAGSERDVLEKKFIKLASDEGIKGVAGHRSVGGECCVF